jgi:hypothetical protein
MANMTNFLNSMLGNPLTHMGLGMLAQSGASRLPQGMSGVGRGGLLGMQSFMQQQQATELNKLRQLKRNQLEQEQAALARILGSAGGESSHPGRGSGTPGTGLRGGESIESVLPSMLQVPELRKSALEGMLASQGPQGAFEGKGMTAQAANQYIDQQTRAFEAANPDATPEQVAVFRQQVTDAMAKRHLMTPSTGYDPVTGAPRIMQPPPLPELGEASQPPTAQPPTAPSKVGRQLTEPELDRANLPPGTLAIHTQSGVPKVIRVPSEAQQKARHFAQRMRGAESETWEDEQGQMQTSGLTALEKNPEKLTGRLQFMTAQSGALGESVIGSEYARYLQYARTWIAGLLRYDSGAAVPEEEFWRYFTTNFAMPGNDEAIIRQKQRARKREADSLAKTGRLSDGSAPWEERQGTSTPGQAAGARTPPPPGFIPLPP